MRGAVSVRRRAVDRLMLSLVVLAAIVALVPLGLILGYLLVKGVPALRPQFFVQNPAPLGMAGGGMANAIVGTLVIVTLAALIAVPLGILTGVYLNEFGRGWFAAAVRFLSDTLAGVPSIVAGIFAYTLVVLTLGHFSAFAGSVALAVLMLPVVVRTTEESLRLVPRDLREAALGLGIRQWRVTVQVVLPAALGPIVTGALLAIARASGETAPLLFTAFGSPNLQLNPLLPMSALPLQIFVYATSPYEVSRQLAWEGAVTLVAIVLVTSAAARIVAARAVASR